MGQTRSCSDRLGATGPAIGKRRIYISKKSYAARLVVVATGEAKAGTT
jgi:hypothetical protein